MNRKILATATLALLLVAAPVAGAVTLPAGPLEGEADEFEDTGTATVSYDRVQATVTVAEDSADVGLTGPRWTDFDTTYLRIDYNEGVTRTLTLRLPEAYATPRPKDGLEAAQSDLTADIRRADGGEATVVALRATGETDVVFPLSKAAGIVFSVRDGVRSRISNQTGIPIPALSSQGEWSVVNDPLQPQSMYRIRHGNLSGPLAIQYDAAGDGHWVPIAPCDTEDTPICELERASNGSVTTVLADAADPPRMRYQVSPGIPARIQASVNEMLILPDRLREAFDELLNGVPLL